MKKKNEQKKDTCDFKIYKTQGMLIFFTSAK